MERKSDYERDIDKKREENNRFLRSLSLIAPHDVIDVLNKPAPVEKPATKKRVRLQDKEPAAKKRHSHVAAKQVPDGSRMQTRSRVKGETKSQKEDHEQQEATVNRVSKLPPRTNKFGHIDDIPVGTVFTSRLECSHAGVHRPTVAGIHGSESVGAYSIAMSGGYEDDKDEGYTFTYTGSGGRDLKGTKANPKNLRTAAQSKHQTLTGVNLALSLNVKSREPVRVVRSHTLNSPYAPEEGFRYDGLYTVESCEATTGKAGFIVYKYMFRRCEDQDPAPWLDEEEGEVAAEN